MADRQLSGSDIQDLINHIEDFGTGLKREDLAYIEGADAVWEYICHTRACNPEKRLEYAIEEIIGLGQPDLLDGVNYLVLIVSSPEHQLLMKELPQVGVIINHLQQYGEVTFDFGTKEGLGTEVEVLIIRSKMRQLLFE